MTKELIPATDRDAANLPGWSKHAPIETNNKFGGVQYLFRFENGYGASLINHEGSYGNEIAVIEWMGANYDLTYSTPITNDVLGWLSPDEIEFTLDAIKALPSSRGEINA